MPLQAQTFPQRLVTIVVPSGPGSGFDLVARVLADQLAKDWNRPVVVENRPGGGMVIGSENVARADPDGHKLLLTNEGAIVVNKLLEQPTSGTTSKPLRPVSLITDTPYFVFVGGQGPFRSFEDLLSYAKEHPSKLNAAFGSNGTALYIDLLKKITRTDLAKVGYADSVSTLNAVAKGEVDMTITSAVSGIGMIKGGLIRPLLVASKARSRLTPDVPTASEAGLPDFLLSSWMGLFAPTATPPEAIDSIQRSVRHAIDMPEVRTRLEKLNVDVQDGTRQSLEQLIDRDFNSLSQLLKTLELKNDGTSQPRK